MTSVKKIREIYLEPFLDELILLHPALKAVTGEIDNLSPPKLALNGATKVLSDVNLLATQMGVNNSTNSQNHFFDTPKLNYAESAIIAIWNICQRIKTISLKPIKSSLRKNKHLKYLEQQLEYLDKQSWRLQVIDFKTYQLSKLIKESLGCILNDDKLFNSVNKIKIPKLKLKLGEQSKIFRDMGREYLQLLNEDSDKFAARHMLAESKQADKLDMLPFLDDEIHSDQKQGLRNRYLDSIESMFRSMETNLKCLHIDLLSQDGERKESEPLENQVQTQINRLFKHQLTLEKYILDHQKWHNYFEILARNDLPMPRLVTITALSKRVINSATSMHEQCIAMQQECKERLELYKTYCGNKENFNGKLQDYLQQRHKRHFIKDYFCHLAAVCFKNFDYKPDNLMRHEYIHDTLEPALRMFVYDGNLEAVLKVVDQGIVEFPSRRKQNPEGLTSHLVDLKYDLSDICCTDLTISSSISEINMSEDGTDAEPFFPPDSAVLVNP